MPTPFLSSYPGIRIFSTNPRMLTSFLSTLTHRQPKQQINNRCRTSKHASLASIHRRRPNRHSERFRKSPRGAVPRQRRADHQRAAPTVELDRRCGPLLVLRRHAARALRRLYHERRRARRHIVETIPGVLLPRPAPRSCPGIGGGGGCAPGRDGRDSGGMGRRWSRRAGCGVEACAGKCWIPRVQGYRRRAHRGHGRRGCEDCRLSGFRHQRAVIYLLLHVDVGTSVAIDVRIKSAC